MTLMVVIVVIVMAIGTIAFVMLNSPSASQSSSTTSPSSSASAISPSSSSSISSTSSSTSSSTTYSTSSASGLDLQITLNATTVKAGSPLTAQVSLFNTLATNLSLSANYSANPNITNWDNYDSLCGLSSVDDIAGYALFQGNYGSGNLSRAGTPMLLTPPVAAASCPNRFANQAYIQNVQFAPNSDLATLSTNASFANQFKAFTVNAIMNATTGSCAFGPVVNQTATIGENGVTSTVTSSEVSWWGCGSYGPQELDGYWTMPASGYVNINYSSNSIIGGLNSAHANYFHTFSPGSYTLMAEDMWDQTVYAHFQVTQAQTTTTTTTTSSSTQQSTLCTISGQPGDMYLRVVPDSNQTLIKGAEVTATNIPASCGSDTSTVTVAANTQTTTSFTTNGQTEWYTLNGENNAGYSFVVSYSGHTYNFTADLAPLSATCVTLFIPSGRTSVSIETYQSSCTSTSTTSSYSSQQAGSLSWDANYGVWNYEVTLNTNDIQQDQNLTAIFTLTNFSNQTQTVDIDDPLVLPTIYSMNGTVVWAYRPPNYNEIENVSAGHAITEQMTIPTWMLSAGQSYVLSTSPGIGTPDFTIDIGSHLQLNQTITVA